jgi:DNA polymerase-1
MEIKHLFLIDGYSLLYRSYYAIRNLSNSEGFPTNAIFGFLSTLKKINTQEKPHYLGVVFDSKGPTFRHELYKAYKAARKPMPEDLVVQIPVLKKIISALNIPSFEHKGYEADDLLGSLTKSAAKHNIQTVLVSTDKDLYQLIDDSTVMFNPAKEIYIDKNEVLKLFGATPEQVVDVLALWGDHSDNIPGVPGIGEKTAKSLISQFGSIEKLLGNPDQIKNPKIREKIKENMGLLELSRRLATIERGIPVEVDLDALSVCSPDRDKLIPLLQEMGFSSLLSSFLDHASTKEQEYKVLLKESDLKTLVAHIKKEGAVSLDTETTSSFPTQACLVGMSFSIKPGEAFYLPLRHDYDKAPKQISKKRAFSLLKEVLTSPKIKKIGQNIKYDYIVLKREGLEIKGIDQDSMVLSYLLEPNWGRHSLSRLAETYLHVKASAYHDIVGKGKNEVTMNAIDIAKVTPYACQDADFALKITRLLWPKIEEKGLSSLYRKLEQPLIEVLAEMEIWGIKVQAETLGELSAELKEEMGFLRKKIYSICGEEFNLNSYQQLSRILFEKLGLPPSRKTKATKEFSTNVAVLQELALKHPIAQYALEYRQLAKLKSGYADSLPRLINPETGRIHTSYNQTVASTGRLSSSDPNLQNIPARGKMGLRFRKAFIPEEGFLFRKAFIPEEGFLFLSADYSQIELRVLAHLSKDRTLIDSFKQGRDIHKETAARVFTDSTGLFAEEARRRAKIINFSIIYGTSAFSLAKELGASTTDAQVFIDLYYEQYPEIKEFLDRIVTDAEVKGCSETLFGRIRQVPELRHQNRTVQQAGRRIALNTPIQGTAADLMKKAMIDIWREIKKKKLQTRMVLQVHDELVFEVPDAEQKIMETLVKTRMEEVFPLDVPLKVHLGWGVNWAEAK